MTARIGVVTVAYRSDEILPDFFASLDSATSEEIELVVVDNKPTGETVREMTEGRGGRYLPLPSNPGYGGAVNEGVRALSPSVEWILVSNPDIVLGPDSIDRLVAAGLAASDIGAVGPLVMTGGVPYPSARAVPSLATGIGHALLANVRPTNRWTTRYHLGNATDGAERDAGWLSGACLLVRRSAFDQVSGFDQRYFMYFEDVDLGYRLGQAGWRNRYAPAAVVEHSGGHSTESESAAMVEAHHRSAYRFLAGRYAHPLLLPVRIAIRIGLALRARLATRAARRESRFQTPT
ncbi:glycosyltransferase family 2 protein [Herbiconiux liangxiaofengii]|uniref:glycosyltransferase family 2 protein n=1 Tax=Herbiconiux liangxiaofengii TaxID=3342795 RepID=UPI0035B75AB2